VVEIRSTLRLATTTTSPNIMVPETQKQADLPSPEMYVLSME